ncbi:hypothetical protein CY35_16G037600 [Sphagnum magellanicum]|nr:hypothetical protein CY35_16G037600 [Sphagnum magellanicum]KAH9537159.1 hypothetical protein CY35_16G037600 [Sphagnum magellanicum]
MALEGSGDLKLVLAMETDPLPLDNARAEDWRKALAKVVPAVVVLRTTATRAFDTEAAGASYATGFVVDKERGILLTNRHVIKPGPIVAEAMFVNREEISVFPLYRDPVHDFGFLWYDPKAVQFMEYEAIPLAPEAAAVGLEIRVVGNDSGEKVSILAGTLARMDRDAPQYKKDGYNDFNTFYIQAASGTKGGSSGSPVIDNNGRAVALNAGSKSTSASAFFLPLERVVRALKFLQDKKDSCQDGWEPVTIPRGTLQMTFSHKGFDEIRRLGLKRDTEKLIREASPTAETGMLVVESLVPGGPAHKLLEPGDVLLRANGDRVPLEFVSHADRHRSKSVLVTIDRHEWYALPQLYTRNDATGLWDVCPAEPKGKPLVQTSHEDMELEPLLVPVGVPEAVSSNGKVADHQLHEGNGVAEDLLVGATPVNEAEIEGIVLPKRQKVHELLPTEEPSSEGTLGTSAEVHKIMPSTSSSMAEHAIEPTLVMMEVHVPPSAMLDGVHAQHFFGTGVIVHHSQDLGLVAVDKNTVAIAVSDVMLSFAAFPMEVSAEVVFLHPVHNFALVAYNPATLGTAGSAAVHAADLVPDPPVRRGDSVYLVGLSRSLQATSRKSIVTNPGAALNVGAADCPRYRSMNMEVIELDTDFGHTFSGVLADDLGRVKALWGSFSTHLKYGDSSPEDHQFVRGIPIYAISEVLEMIIKGNTGPPLLINGVKWSMPLMPILEAELYPTLLSKARSFGLSDRWVEALAKKDPVRRQVLRVKGCLAGSRAASTLEQGDMLLAISGQPITCFRDVEIACQSQNFTSSVSDHAQDGETPNVLQVTVFRQGHEMEVGVGIDIRDGFGTRRMVNWAGCVLQDPHSAVRALGFLPQEGHGVYVARWCHGSPAHRYGLYALQWIVEVNGMPTPDLQAFIDVTQELDHCAFVRVKTIHLNGKPRVLTVKQDLHYWPTWELHLDPTMGAWRRRVLKAHKK